MTEMKTGYKQTDIGVIPEDWDVKSYGEVFDFLSIISNSRADLCFKGDFGYIHYGDIHTRWENTLDLSKNELPELRRDKIKKLPASLRDGDLVMADASEDCEGIAKTVEVKNIREKKVFSGLHTFLMRDRNAVFSDGIRGYIHEMPVVRQQIQKVATGLKVFGVSKNTLKNVQILVPKPEEQKQIAAALSDVDGLIESLSQLIAKKRDMKTAAMQQLLTGKNRLPGFHEEWTECQLGERVDFFKGKSLSKAAIVENAPDKCIHYGDLFTFYPEKIINIRSRTYQDKADSFLSKENDVLMPTSDVTPNGLAKASCIQEDGVILGGDILIIRAKEKNKINGVFLSYFIRLFKDEIMKRVSGTTVYHLYASGLKTFPLWLPSYEEQKAISQILFDIDIEIDTLAKACSFKTGMMQELLTGKTRLIKADKKFEKDGAKLVMTEMKTGYKQTDIGVIPEDWDVASLGKLFEITSSKRVFQNEWRKSGVPFYRARELAVLGEKGRVDNDLFIDHDLYEKYKRSYGMPQVGDVLVTGVGTLGKVYVVPDETAFYFKDGNIIWFKVKGKLNSYFLKQLYYTPLIEYQISEFSAGSTVGTYTITGAKKTLIPFPKPEEQKQIAAALSNVDGLVESLEKLAVKKRDMKTAAMQQLLTGKKRLPGFDGEWNKRTLGELGDCIIGLTYSPSQINESGTLVLRSSNIQNGVLKFEDNVRVISKIPEKLMVRQNDILVCVRNGSRALIGKCVLINQNAIGMTFGAFMSVYRSEFGSFIFYQFQSDVIQEQINKNLGVTINQITNKTMRSFEIDFPEDENERNAIVSILSDMDSEIDILEQRFAKARSLKTGMMQELLTGKTRLIKVDKKQEVT